jgi:hypothetical protein
LGRLPPAATAAVLAYLDRASLAALRQACRQSYLLVGAATSAVGVDALGVLRATALPLEAVAPNARLVALQLGLSTSTSSSSLLPAGRASLGGAASRALAAGRRDDRDDDVARRLTGAVADKGLSFMLRHCGLHAMAALRVLDLSSTTVGLGHAVWDGIGAALALAQAPLPQLQRHPGGGAALPDQSGLVAGSSSCWREGRQSRAQPSVTARVPLRCLASAEGGGAGSGAPRSGSWVLKGRLGLPTSTTLYTPQHSRVTRSLLANLAALARPAVGVRQRAGAGRPLSGSPLPYPGASRAAATPPCPVWPTLPADSGWEQEHGCLAPPCQRRRVRLELEGGQLLVRGPSTRKSQVPR